MLFRAFAAGAAGQGLDGPDHPDGHGAGAGPDRRRPARHAAVVALDLLRERAPRHRRVRRSGSSSSASTASRPPAGSTPPASCSAVGASPSCSTRCRRGRSRAGDRRSSSLRPSPASSRSLVLAWVELRQPHPMLALRLLADRMFRNANLVLAALVRQLRRRAVHAAALPPGPPRPHGAPVRAHHLPAGHRRADLVPDRRPALPDRRPPAAHGVRAARRGRAPSRPSRRST